MGGDGLATQKLGKPVLQSFRRDKHELFLQLLNLLKMYVSQKAG
jgi:hypothetical protein